MRRAHRAPIRPPALAGIVLAAGASSRMGASKALLPLPGGGPLAAWQAARLRAAGCGAVVIVLGAGAEAAARGLPGERMVVNEGWSRGRCGSVQAGLRAFTNASRFLVLPVDNVLVADETLRALAAPGRGVVRPWSARGPGRLVRLDRAAAGRVLDLPADARLDALLAREERRLAVPDALAGSNIDTPAAWAFARYLLAKRAAIA